MFSFFRTSARRQAIRDDLMESQEERSRWSPRVGVLLANASVFFIIAVVLSLFPSDKVTLQVGQTAAADITSPVPNSFILEDPILTEKVREEVRRQTWPVLVPQIATHELIRSQLQDLREDVVALPAGSLVPATILNRWPGITPATVAWLRSVDSETYTVKIRLFLTQLGKYPLVKANAIPTEQPTFYVASAAPQQTPTRTVDRDNLIILSDAATAMPHLSALVSEAFPAVMHEVVAGYLQQLQQPTYAYDARQTRLLAAQRAADVPNQGQPINKGEVLIKRGEVITQAALNRYHAVHREFERYRLNELPWAWWLGRFGQIGAIFIAVGGGAIFASTLHKRIGSTGRGWCVTAILAVTLVWAKIAIFAPQSLYLLGIVPTLWAAVTLMIVFGPRVAMALTAVHAVLVTMMLGQSLDFLLPVLAGCATFAFGLRELRNRARLIKVSLATATVLGTTVLSMGLASYMHPDWSGAQTATPDVQGIVRNAIWAAGAGILAGFLTIGLLPVIERVFRITTNMTLLELADMNQPLLRRLASEAPGTYNHCLSVGAMAEAVANAIGANGLRARVGAYYHDIGKMPKPHYFAENQTGGTNRHDKLSPAMSLLIIVGHVKDGIEIAREYHLPRQVMDFIAEHHGTTLVEYFYHAAREKQARDLTQPQVSETEFRYPGPKPRSRETAILMICDGVESITRAMSEHTPGRLENVVQGVIKKRLDDGQFSECDLTFKDLQTIEQALIRTLAGVYHGRVAYPKTPTSRAS